MRAAHLVCALLAGSVAFAQAPDPKLVFEVASVKPAAPSGNSPFANVFQMRGGPGTDDAGQIHYSNVALQVLLMRAYGLKMRYQLEEPNWLTSLTFDIEAKVPAGATLEDLNIMIQNLLIERFHLAAHRENRELAGYELVLSKGGSKMRETPEAELAPAPGAAPGARGPIKMRKDKDGLQELEPGAKAMTMFGIAHGGQRYSARGQDLAVLTQTLENPLGKPVHNATGLTGKYDFNLTFSADERTSANRGGAAPAVDAAADDPGRPPDLFTALQEQLGLKLEQKKVPVEMLVVDRMDRTPTEN
ncbi:MAG TPA: TIGR03435 family protein [Bryobacteraceae bacterium]|jgi:uncharacterized protein (TIGR03435 family)